MADHCKAAMGLPTRPGVALQADLQRNGRPVPRAAQRQRLMRFPRCRIEDLDSRCFR